MTDQEAFVDFYRKSSILGMTPALAPDAWQETYLLGDAERQWVAWQACAAYIKSQTLETVLAACEDLKQQAMDRVGEVHNV